MAPRQKPGDLPPAEHVYADPHELSTNSFSGATARDEATHDEYRLSDVQAPSNARALHGSLSPLTVDAEGLAGLLGISLRTVRKLNASARLPRPVSLGRRRLWSVREIESWLEKGAPGRDRWETLKQDR